jgi:hypothetical protein
MSNEIALCKKRIESWSKDFNQQLQGEIERFACYVKDQCELHRYRLLEELESLEKILDPQPTSSVRADHSVDLHIDLTHENANVETEQEELPRKRMRSSSSSENRKNSLRRSQRSSLSEERRQSVSIARRSLRVKPRVSYVTDDDDEILDSSPDSGRHRLTASTSSDQFHQLLSSTPSSHLILSESLPSPPPPSLPPSPAQIVAPLVVVPSSSSSSSSKLLSLYQCYIMKLLSCPAPQRYQFRHYQDIYYLWGGYFQTRPFAMSYKLIMDFLHFYSDQNNYDGRSNTRLMRQAIHNLIRSGDLVLLDSNDESSVFVSLDDDKDCIAHKLMIAVPLSQDLIDDHVKYDQQIIEELVQIYYDIYCRLAFAEPLESDEPPSRSTSRTSHRSTLSHNSGKNDRNSTASSNQISTENPFVPLIKLQQQFFSAIQSGECQKICQRYPQPGPEEGTIPWEYCLPPHDLWRVYRRYEMVNLNCFHKYLEAQQLVQIIKSTKVDVLRWVAAMEEHSDDGS